MKTMFARHICRMLIVCMAAFPFAAHAGMIGTDQLVSAARPQDESARDQLRDLISRSDVRDQLQRYGISPAAAQARVNAMTDAEAASLAAQIEKLPAGGISNWAVAAGMLVIGLIWYHWVK